MKKKETKKKPASQKSWIRKQGKYDLEILDEYVYSKKPIRKPMTPKVYREKKDFNIKEKKDEWIEGTIIEVTASSCLVNFENKNVRCVLRKGLKVGEQLSKNIIAVGDKVLISLINHNSGVIEKILERRTILSRINPLNIKQEQIIVTNVDQIAILMSCKEPEFNPGILDRYLVSAEKGGLGIIIVINKIDLDEGNSRRKHIELYKKIGYRVIETSVPKKTGIEELRKNLIGKITVFAGPSGVGKSSLITAIQPDLKLKSKPVSKKTGFGRHTTVNVKLLPIQPDGFVVDTPGIRAFRMWELLPDEVVEYFPEFVSKRNKCEFNNCTHINEPDCAIKKAIESGEIDISRYNSYLKIYKEAKRKFKY